ncbi:MAG TPA: hypothetical protein VKY19_14255 [Ktedonosporobacter sp.]|jgi:hypothetical protein|nr:hypothetical protein [Ktedonosporobacter sp.]
MADLSKLKKRNSLGAPPSFEEASLNLAAPEIAPILPQPQQADSEIQRIDGRSLRKTDRNVQFATKVRQVFDERFRSIAARDNLVFGDLLEKMLDAYEANRR